MEKPGRHRFVQLKDLVEYQETERRARRDALAEMTRQAEELDLNDATDGPVPATR